MVNHPNRSKAVKPHSPTEWDVEIMANHPNRSRVRRTMHLYQWTSEALENYAPGYALAIGATVEEARANARAAFLAHAKDRWCYYFTGDDPDDKSMAAEKIALFEADISKEPVTGLAFCISGSE